MLTIGEIREKVIPILKSAGARKGALFGSYARGEETAESDIDILADFPIDTSLFKIGGVQYQLQETLGRKVDLVQYIAIKPLLRPYIMKDELIFFG